MATIDLQVLVSSIGRDIQKVKIVRYDDLYAYYEHNELSPDSIMQECTKELEEIFTRDVHQCTKRKDYTRLNIAIHRILGVARYMFADRLVVMCSSYIDALNTADMKSRVHTRGNVEQMVVSLNLILRSVLTDSIDAFDNPPEEVEESNGEDQFTSLGMQRVASSEDEGDGTTEDESLNYSQKV